jgi:hypothetical protein
MAIDFGDIASRYATARLNQATQPFTDPEAYLNNRMMQNYGVDLNGNSAPVSTTIKYNTDTGAPETVTTKHEVGTPNYSAGADYTLPTPQAQPAMGLQMPTTPAVGMQMPQTMPAAPPAPVAVPDAQAIDEQRRRQLEQAQLQAAQAQQAQQMAEAAPAPAPVAQPAPVPTGPAVPTVEREVPQPPPMPVSPQAVAQQAAPVALPQFGPGVQVTGGPAGTGVAEAAKAAAPPAVVTPPPQWQTDLNAAQGNEQKLSSIVSNESYPEEARKKASEGLRSYYKDVDEKTRAEKVVMAAAQGDVKAQNELIRAIRPTQTNKKEQEEGSYIKAILFARLGLTDLAHEEQAKITNKTKFEQGMMDGQHYQLERDRNGRLVGALDESGQQVPENTLAKLAAAVMKTGTHAFGFAGEAAIVPKGHANAGDEVRPRQNAMTGDAEYVYVTGPKKGQTYIGPTPIAKSVGTAISKKEGIEAVTLRYAGPLSYSRASAGYAGKFNTENPGANIAWVTPSAGAAPVLVDRNNNDALVRPDSSGNISVVKKQPEAQAATTQTAGNLLPSPKFREPGHEGETPGNFQERVKATTEANKTIAKEGAKVVAASPDTQNLIKDIDKVIGFIDSGEHNIGSKLSGVVGRGPIAQSIGKQFETQQSTNTQIILDTVNKLATEGLKVLGANPSEGDRKFWTANKPNAESSPEFMKSWLESRKADLERRLSFGATQTRQGGTAGAAGPVTRGSGTRDDPVKLD